MGSVPVSARNNLSHTPDLTFGSNNRITTSGYSYDAAGNLTADPHYTYAYDAENHMISATGMSSYTYTYDGEGRRVKKSSGSLRMVYGIGGELLIECDSSTGSLKKEYVYGVNGLLATIDSTNGTLYTTSDHLGSPRMITNSSGAVFSKHDYMPFGEEIMAGTGTYLYNVRTTAMQYLTTAQSDGLRQEFTAKERDTETGLDYFGARYFASTQGRFTSPDDFINDTHVPSRRVGICMVTLGIIRFDLLIQPAKSKRILTALLRLILTRSTRKLGSRRTLSLFIFKNWGKTVQPRRPNGEQSKARYIRTTARR